MSWNEYIKEHEAKGNAVPAVQERETVLARRRLSVERGGEAAPRVTQTQESNGEEDKGNGGEAEEEEEEGRSGGEEDEEGDKEDEDVANGDDSSDEDDSELLEDVYRYGTQHGDMDGLWVGYKPRDRG